jgi:prepilin-type N-terminal cleavage/methylation domain-containing protein
MAEGVALGACRTTIRAGSRRGFTLLEMSVVMAIIGIVSAGALVCLGAYVQSNTYNTTIAEMDTIEQALLNYSTAKQRVPCPSNLTCVAGQLNYGAEGNCASTTASCTTGTTGVNFLDSMGDAEGGVPTRALGLPDSYMYDAWGRRFRYAAALRGTIAGTIPAATALCDNGISVNDATGATRTTEAVYALISHGANGHGAYTQNGTIVNAGSLNAAELNNCHCGSNGAFSGTYYAQYIEQMPILNNASGALYSFDDLVTFKEAWQLGTPANPVKPAGNCVYIADGEWGTVRAVNSAGIINLVAGQLTGVQNTGCSNLYSGDGGLASWATLGSVGGMATDSSGNLYFVDYCDTRLLKIDGKTSVIKTLLGPSGSGRTAQTSMTTTMNLLATAVYLPIWANATNLAIDSSGGLYFAGNQFGPVTKMTASTTRVQIVAGAGVPNWDYTSGWAVTDGGLATHAKFMYMTSLAVDTSGNLYIGDNWTGYTGFPSTGTNVIRKVTASTGIVNLYAGNYGGGGSCCGASIGNGGLATWAGLEEPGVMIFDANNNLFIGDSNNMLREVTATDGMINTLMCTSGCSAAGMSLTPALASLNDFAVGAMAFDTSGYMYMTGINWGYGELISKMNLSKPQMMQRIGGYDGGQGSLPGIGVLATAGVFTGGGIAVSNPYIPAPPEASR